MLHSGHKPETSAITFSGLSWTQKTSVPKGQSDNESGGFALPEMKFSEKQISATSYLLKKLSFTSFLRSF